MIYTPAHIPDDLTGTSTAILWTAANILATNPASIDALAEATAQVGHHNPTIGAELTSMLEHAAVAKAAARFSLLAAIPTGEPTFAWSTWQKAAQGRFELWPILADLADRHESEHDQRNGLTPGRYDHAAFASSSN